MSIAAEPMAAEGYDRTTVLLHWATAGLVALLWVIAQLIDDFPSGTPRVMVRSLHIALGLALLAVVLRRMAWRWTGGRRLPPDQPAWMHRLAQVVHFGLYALVAVTLLLGIGNLLIRGDSIFRLFTMPSLAPGNRAWRDQIGDLHGLAANLLLILAGLHGAVALLHHYVLRDDVLRRMRLERRISRT